MRWPASKHASVSPIARRLRTDLSWFNPTSLTRQRTIMMRQTDDGTNHCHGEPAIRHLRLQLNTHRGKEGGLGPLASTLLYHCSHARQPVQHHRVTGHSNLDVPAVSALETLDTTQTCSQLETCLPCSWVFGKPVTMLKGAAARAPARDNQEVVFVGALCTCAIVSGVSAQPPRLVMSDPPQYYT
jgi:hypothetical protein